MRSTPTRAFPRLLLFLLLGMQGCSPEPHPIDVVEATIAQVQEALLAGETTCRMVVQAYLDRIEAYEETTVNAITVVNPRALSRADEIDAALAEGDGLGSLFCVPMLVKDNFDTHDTVSYTHLTLPTN